MREARGVCASRFDSGAEMYGGLWDEAQDRNGHRRACFCYMHVFCGGFG